MGSAATERIFLYGTLRRGGSRDVVEFYGGGEFLGAARMRGALYDLGDYPGLVLSETGGWVRGEIFDVTPETLARLDEWEGIDPRASESGEYRRLRAVAEADEGNPAACWVYEIRPRACEGRPLIASGDWIAHRASFP